jgi:peptidoglycan/LPS O-acetylase OafA/YrhL
MKASTESRRFLELDAIRGLAAFSVLLHHLLLLWKDEILGSSEPRFRKVLQVLLQPFSAGHEAVVLFFVLSGLVLSIPWIEGRPQSYPVFMIRRIFRIYFPYLVALVCAVAGNAFLFGPVTKSALFRQFWATPPAFSDIVNHLLFLGVYNRDRFDPPIWSLVHELRISIFFPAICMAAMVLKPRRLLAVCAAISLACCWFVVRVPPVSADILKSLHFCAFFVLGIFIYSNSGWIRERFLRTSLRSRALLLTISLGLYWYGSKFLIDNPWLARQPVNAEMLGDWLTAIGAATVIVFGMNSEAFRKFLLRKPLLGLGEMSFSLYLTHFIVILALMHGFYGKINYSLLLIACLVASLLFSRLFFIAVERPSMNLGRRVSRLIQPRVAPAALPALPGDLHDVAVTPAPTDL